MQYRIVSNTFIKTKNNAPKVADKKCIFSFQTSLNFHVV